MKPKQFLSYVFQGKASIKGLSALGLAHDTDMYQVLVNGMSTASGIPVKEKLQKK